MSDLEFVRRCLEHDKRAWDEFVDRYSRLIYNYIYSILKLYGSQGASQNNINDIFQDIFLLLTRDNFKKLRSFQARGGCSLASWLRQVTINYTIDCLRKTKALVSLDEDTGDNFDLKDTIADNSPLISEGLDNLDKLDYLKDCIGELDTEDKYFLELHINQGVRLEDLKDLLNISRGAVDMRKTKIISRLRDCFKTKGFKLDFRG